MTFFALELCHIWVLFLQLLKLSFKQVYKKLCSGAFLNDCYYKGYKGVGWKFIRRVKKMEEKSGCWWERSSVEKERWKAGEKADDPGRDIREGVRTRAGIGQKWGGVGGREDFFHCWGRGGGKPGLRCNRVCRSGDGREGVGGCHHHIQFCMSASRLMSPEYFCKCKIRARPALIKAY